MRKFLFLLSFLASVVGVGQQANVTLDVKPSDGQRTVRQDQTTIDAAKAVYPNWYARAKVLGWTDAQFLDQSKFVAKWQQLQYFTSSLGPNSPTASTVNVTVPEGEYYVNATCELGYGTYRGAGTFVYYPGNYSTTLSVWHAKWIGTGPRDIFHTAMWGTNVEGSYAESFRFEGFRLDGKAATAILADPSYRSTGAVFFDCGETENVEYVYAHSFNNIGLEFERGTPATANTLTVFNNCDAGIMLTGTAGNTLNFGTISGDDNGVLVEMRAGGGRQPGGQLFIACMKSEAGVTPISRNPHRKQKLMVLRGQFGVNVGVARGSHSQVRVDNLIEVDCRLTDGNKQVSNLTIGSINGFNYGNAVKDLANGWEAADPGDYNCYSLQYTSANGGNLWNPFHTFTKVGGGVTNPPVNPPTNPPVNPPTTVLKYTETRTTATTATTRKTAPATLGTVSYVKLVKFKVPSNLKVAWINSSLFIGQNDVTKVWGLWTYVNGVMLEVGIPVTPDQVLDTPSIPIGSALTHTIGSPNGSTALWSGTIEHY